MKTTSILLTLVLSIPLSALAGNNIFVDALKGNDKNPGTSNLPKKTIQAGIQIAQSGDFVFVEEGVYKEKISFPRNGADWGGKIIVTANHKHRAIIDASGLPNDGKPVVDISNREFIAFQDFVIKNVTGTVIKVTGSKDVEVSGHDIMNVKADKTGQSSILVGSSQKVLIKDNALAKLTIGQNAAIMIEKETSNFRINYNIITDTKGAGIVNYGSEGEISHNEMARVSAGVASQGKNIMMDANTVSEATLGIVDRNTNDSVTTPKAKKRR